MKTKVIYFIFLGLLFACQKKNDKNNDECELLNSQFSLIQSNTFIQLESEDIYFPNSENGLLMTGESIKIEDYLNGVKLLLRYSDSHCNSCFEKAMQALHKYKDDIGEENVILLTSHKNYRVLKITLEKMNFNPIVINIPEIEIPIEEYRTPYFFIINKDLRMSSVFIPIKEIPNYTEKYLYTIYNKYFRN